MITGGNATVYISDMETAVTFYTEVLGLKLSSRYGDAWATVDAGAFTIGLHPKSEKRTAPGTPGSILIGLSIDEAVEEFAARLKSHGVQNVSEIERGSGGSFVHFCDPDGNELYLWEMPR